MSANYQDIIKAGLWHNNQALVALLGLCPLLAVTNTLINGLGLGIATTLTLICSGMIISLIRKFISHDIRLPLFVLVIASVVTSIELLMNAYFHNLYKVLGIFIPLIVTNCAIVGRAEIFASKNPVAPSMVDGCAVGIGFTFVLVVLGGFREIFGSGTLLSDADLLFGAIGTNWTVTIVENYRGFLLAILPPGAFIGLGILVALKNIIDNRIQIEQGETKRDF